MSALRPNLFARVFKSWGRLHPYNAAQAMRIRGGNAITLADRCDQALAPLGKCRRVEVLGPSMSLDRYLTGCINRPFAEDDPLPIRPFVQPAPDGTHAWAGLTYDHWLADSVAIRQLMHRWLQAVHDQPLTPMPRFESVPPPRKLGLTRDLALVTRMLRCRRLEKEVLGGDSCYLHLPLDPGLCGRLRSAARRHGAKVNDIFLAAAGLAAARHIATERSVKRIDLGVGSIVDTRRYLPESQRHAFGLMLGFIRVVLRPHHLGHPADALAAVAYQSRLAMKNDDPISGSATLQLGLLASRYLDNEALRKFYRKRMPLLAGVSNVNLDGTTLGAEHPDTLVQYVRVSPLGPTMPIVFTPTTLGNELSLGVTYRTAAVGAANAERCIETFVQTLEKLTKLPPSDS
ncbi:MAG: hypothetical protein AAF743_03985 [Planctomycetota bacterium]